MRRAMKICVVSDSHGDSDRIDRVVRAEDAVCDAYVHLGDIAQDAERLMELSFSKLNLSARAYTRLIKVARTIADMAGKADIGAQSIAEALQYRSLDAKYWGS